MAIIAMLMSVLGFEGCIRFNQPSLYGVPTDILYREDSVSVDDTEDADTVAETISEDDTPAPLSE